MVSWGVNFPHKNGPIPLWLAPYLITSKSPQSIRSSKSYKYDNYDKTKYRLDLPGRPDHQAIHFPRANLGPLSRSSLTNPIIIIVFDTYLTPSSPGVWFWAKSLPILNKVP